jgi:site-specific recombinase XerD
MSPRTKTIQEWTLASVALRDAYTDFILSRQAARCSPSTIAFYNFTAGRFLTWLEARGITSPADVLGRHVRVFLAELASAGKADTTIHDNARAIRTLVRFWHAENYIPAPLMFALPKVAAKRLPVLSAEQVTKIVRACGNVRDRALILLFVDSGLRREEVRALNWGDVDFASGLVTVKRGKGGKARSAVIGATARRALLAYRRTMDKPAETTPLFSTRRGGRFTGSGLLVIFRRLSAKTRIHVTPHALRRTFVILSLRAEMDVLHLQALLGHSGLEMVQHYAQMVDDDLLKAHEKHSPVDNLSRLAK